MATERIRIRDKPERFRFKLGQQVVKRDATGYADAEYEGEIVDGLWTGDPAGGSYDEVYEVKRTAGGLFQARELELLRRFDDASLRLEIRGKIKTRQLPRGLPNSPAGDELEGHETMGAPATGSSCSACGHPIPPRHIGGVEYKYPLGASYRFDAGCNAIWLEEIRRPTL